MAQENEALTAANTSLEGRLLEQQTTVENLRNELQAAKHDAAALDSQLTKERAKLAATRQQCADLSEQVETSSMRLRAVCGLCPCVSRFTESPSRHGAAMPTPWPQRPARGIAGASTSRSRGRPSGPPHWNAPPPLSRSRVTTRSSWKR